MAGRNKITGVELVTVEMNGGAVAAANSALTQQGKEMLALQQQLGLSDMSPQTLVRETKLWMEHTARAMFEMGIRLVALRAQCPHGEWLPLLEQQLGISPRTAQRYMMASLKCVGQQGRRDKLLQLERSKVMELVSLDDESLEQLDTTGSLSQLGLDFDDIDRMSLTELRQRLRDREQTIAGKDKLISKRQAKIDALEEQLDRPMSADEKAANAEERAMLIELRDTVTAAEAALLKLTHMLPAFTRGTVSESAALAGQQAAQYLAQRLADALSGAGIEVDLQALIVPDWIPSAKMAKTKSKL